MSPYSHASISIETRSSITRALSAARDQANGPLGSPSRELSLVITKLEEALMWFEAVARA